MDSDLGKLFIGGISWETTEEKLMEYFGQYGAVLQAVVMRDKVTNRPRGFGFVAFADPSVLDTVLAAQHTIDGRTVEAKRALSREEQQTSGRSGNPGAGRAFGGGGSAGAGGNIRTKKIFVGGLPPTLTDEGLRQYFQPYGDVTDVIVMYDSNTQRPRGFGFVTFFSEDSVDKVLEEKNFHELNGKLVEVKRALPKDMNPTNGGGRSSGGGMQQSYGSNNASYEVNTGRYQQATGGGGYPAYGSSGYGAPGGYGYGPASSGIGYGGYGGGFGGGPAGGYTGAAPTAGPPGAARNPWNNQASAGFGGAGYGGSGMTAQPTGQSAAGYGAQGYGYGGYAGAEGAYGSQAGYGAVGGRGGSVGPANPASSAGEQAGASAYMGGGGGGYAAGNGNSGYQASWRSNPSPGGGYGAGQVNGPPGGPASYGPASYGSGGYPGAQHQ